MTHRCRDCEERKIFSLKTGNVMQGSKLGYQQWAIAIHLVTTNLKGILSMKLHRELEITQKSAWHLAHRLRKALKSGKPLFKGPVEADETYIGGKKMNMHKAKRRTMPDHSSAGKTAVIGTKDRATNRISARSTAKTDITTLSRFVAERTEPGADIFTDESSAYNGLNASYDHQAVNHSAGEYVRGGVHTQGIESFWAMLKRGYKGVDHKFSPKHLDRYVAEFEGRHNNRKADAVDQMAGIAAGMTGKRVRYSDLIADNGLPSGARS